MKKKHSIKEILLNEILKGDFLVKEDAYKSWKFLLFLTSLALISVTSSHMMDGQIRELSLLYEQLKEFKSERAELQAELTKNQFDPSLRRKARILGFEDASEPPFELLIFKE